MNTPVLNDAKKTNAPTIKHFPATTLQQGIAAKREKLRQLSFNHRNK